MKYNYIYFLFIQLIGSVAWLLLILSYYRKNTNKILVFQILGTLLYCLHYFLLGAYSGLFICLFEVARDYSYYKTDKDKLIFAGCIPIYIIGGIYSFHSLIDLLPIFASITDGYSLTNNKKIVIIGAFISYTLWVIYDIAVLSISGAITDGLIALSNLSILIFGDRKILRKNRIFTKILD